MPSCSASDAVNVDGMPPTAGGMMSAAAADGTTDARAPAPKGGGCPKEVCRMKELGGPECPPHLCMHGKNGPRPWHFRLPCPDHPEPAPGNPTPRQKVVLESLLPAVNGYVQALEELAARNELTAEEKGRLASLGEWRDKLKSEVPPKK